jgi:hypothetical protein
MLKNIYCRQKNSIVETYNSPKNFPLQMNLLRVPKLQTTKTQKKKQENMKK